jgi:sulfocyanin
MNTTIIIAAVVIIIVVIGLASYFLFFHHTTSPSITSVTTSYMTSSSTTTTTSSTTSTSTTSTASLPPGAYKLPYNPNNKTVFIYLVVSVVGYQFNYNGTSYGQLKIYVPAGWNVMVILTNEQSIPHNANIVLNNTPTPNNANIAQDGKILLYVGDSPSNYMNNGVPPQGTAVGILDNISAGYYWIACGISGHAEGGMWVDLIASNSVTVPYAIISSSSSTSSSTSSPAWG